ncbi:MAG: hypothetical protein QOF58_3415 [Pseudonocardiales bacterium]|nr:hypothetical protein [Pseudonocardiales bacterium]
MATPSTPDTRPHPTRIAAAIGINADTGTNYQLTDAYGVTYTGSPAHLALLAIARPDLSRTMCRETGDAPGIRAAARILIDWFTSEHTDPLHAAEFAALPPLRVCELVDYLFRHGNATALHKVGPEALRQYTGHLLDDPVPSTEHPMPQLVDAARSLAGPDSRWSRLQITATAPHGADTVAIPMDIQASEDIYWQFTAAIPVPIAELNALLLDPDWFIEDYLQDHRELLDQHLTYRDSQTEQPLEIQGRLARPNTAIDAADAPPIKADLFFVGADQASALQTAPFGSRGLAAQFAAAGDQIYSVEVEIDAGAARIAATTAP